MVLRDRSVATRVFLHADAVGLLFARFRGDAFIIAAQAATPHCPGEDRDRSCIYRRVRHRQKQTLLRCCPGAARIQVPEAGENPCRLRVRARALRSGSSPLSARFQPTKSRVCTSRFVAPSGAAADAFHAAASAGRNCIEFLNWSGRGDSNPRPQPWQRPASKMNRNCGMSSTPGVALVMPRRRRRADVVSLVMMGPCRRSQPLRARRRGH